VRDRQSESAAAQLWKC